MDSLDKTISIFDIATDSNESGPKGLIKKFWPTWQIEDEIGDGSYGVVYKCSNKTGTIESHSAVKIISIPQKKSETADLSAEGMTDNEIEDYYARIVDDFGNEISLMVQVKGHPNIVNIEDYRIEKKKDDLGWDMLLRMELLTPFNNYLKENNLSEDDIIKLGTDILTALEVCEKKNIVHRDIKPENIFVNDFGNFKLGDFGIAKRFESLGASHSQKGTFNYMAPEVASGTHYDSTVDIYSLGLVLYRLANNNCLPFLTPENKTSPTARKDALEKRLSGEKIPAPNCQNEALAMAILKALEFNPNDRYKTAAEFKKALINAEKGVPVSVATATVAPIASETIDDLEKTCKISELTPNNAADEKEEGKKKKLLWIPILCIILALFVGIGVFAFSKNKKNQSDRPVIKVSPTVTSEYVQTNTPTATIVSETTEPTATSAVVEITESPKKTAITTGTAKATESPTATAKQTATTTVKPTPTSTKTPTAKPTATPTPKPTPTPSAGGSYYTRSGNYITFGSYPQSEVTDSSLKSSLTSAAGSTSNWTSYNYYISGSTSSFMKYKDVTYGGNKYRGVYFTQYRPYYTNYSSSADYSYQDDNGYYINKIYWFKYEPIKWKILSESNGDAFLVADMILDSQHYHTSSNNYANSHIRSWLNSTFYNTAFSSAEQGKIKTTNVDNSVASTGYSSNSYACSNTNDKIFLLSYKEVTNNSYGFSSTSSRVKKLTSYAKAQGAYFYSGACWWWLRSPYYDFSYIVSDVRYDGYVESYNVYYTSFGVAPALHLTL